MSDYLLKQGTKRTSQSQPIPGSAQVPNSAGGFAWEVTPWTRLNRFLVLGSEGGSYYASERDLTTSNAKAVRECVALDGPRTVEVIAEISEAGRAPKNDPALWALAVCISEGDLETRRAAERALPRVARIGTHLYHFVAYVESMRGWGRLLRRTIGNWYDEKPVGKLAYEVVKYRQRDGWSHRDLLRLAKPTGGYSDGTRAQLYEWITSGTSPSPDAELQKVRGFEFAQAAETPAETARLIADYNLPREALNTDHLNSPEVWEAMLAAGMPMNALVRNLATMTRIGVLTGTSNATQLVLTQLADETAIEKSRIHPIAALKALLTYQSGMGVRGRNTWTPVPQIVDALDGLFYAAFGNVTPTGKRTLLALDISGSMDSGEIAGFPGLTPRAAASAMAMVTARSEQMWEIVGFYSGDGGWSTGHNRYPGYGNVTADGLTPLTLSPRQRLDDIVRETRGLPMGGTDCSLPMRYASARRQEFDTFVIYTDSETWAGEIHPAQALKQYRAEFVPDARLVVVGMVANNFSIADPNDPGMLDVVGFDTAAPEIISGFARGEV